MRGEDLRQGAMFSYISLEERIPSCRRSRRRAEIGSTRSRLADLLAGTPMVRDRPSRDANAGRGS